MRSAADYRKYAEQCLDMAESELPENRTALLGLIDEIRELESKLNEGNAPKGVTPESVEAIDHVRSIGNIGAHMEADVNLIIEIDPGEAQELIGLIEMLFEEWYVARHDRNQRLAKIAAARAAKDALKSGGEGPTG